MGKHIFLFLMTFFLVNYSGIQAQQTDSYIYIQKKDRKKSDWKVIWEDDFNNPALDTVKWSYIPSNNADWGNYMSNDPDCYAISGGKLFLKGIVNPDTINDSRPFLTG